jgi:hypothetical protein
MQPSDPRRDVPNGTDVDPAAPLVVVPAPDVWAILRFETPPRDPPDDLVAFVLREGDEWLLTDDAVAFGDVGVVTRFDAWRTRWERTCVIDPLPHLLRLVEVADEQRRRPEVLARLVAELDGGDDAVASVEELAALADELSLLHEQVVDEDRTGLGIVDRTPGAQREGLAAAWPECVRREVVAGDRELQVLTDPSNELRAVVVTGDHAGQELHLGDVEFGDDGVVVSGRLGALELPISRARPLAWLVPGATAWRVREIPEVLAWARTLTGLPECLADAAARRRPIRFTARRPIATEHDAPGRP